MGLSIRVRTALAAPLAIAALLVAAAAPAGAQVAERDASLTNGTFNEFDETNHQAATLTTTTTHPYDGRYAATASYSGGGANGFSRGLFDLHWGQGDDVWYGGAFYLPAGFKSDMQGEVDLMRWDNWDIDPTHTDRCGVVIYGGDKKGRFVCWQLGVNGSETASIGPFRIPTGRWTWLEVHQHLSTHDGQAQSELFKNGKKVGGTQQANFFGRNVTNIRYGLVATAGSDQRKSLSLGFDRAMVGPHRLDPGPLQKTRG
jgi:hypothetical protein